MTTLTGWAEFSSSSVAAFASGATCKKAQINANVAKILNIYLYLRLWLLVRMPVNPACISLDWKPREIFLLIVVKNSKSPVEG